MGRILHPLFALLASVTRQDLARQVAYLKDENRILRFRLPERLVATDQEKRRLLRFGKELGQQLKEDRPGESGPGTGLRKWGGGGWATVAGCLIARLRPSRPLCFGGTIPPGRGARLRAGRRYRIKRR